MTQPTTTSPRASFQTLGCRVNQYESDAIADMLRARGFTIVPFGDPCDITIVNTCQILDFCRISVDNCTVFFCCPASELIAGLLECIGIQILSLIIGEALTICIISGGY